MSQGFTKGTPIDTDPTLSLNSDIVVPSQKAVKTYVDGGLSNLQIQVNNKADIASPVFTGNPTAPTPASGDNDTSIATTAFVTNAVQQSLSFVGYFGAGTDGNVTISGTVNLANDMHYNDLTIAAGGTLYLNGYRIFVKGTLDLTNAGSNAINNNGYVGNQSVSANGGQNLGAGGRGGYGSTVYGWAVGGSGAVAKNKGGPGGGSGTAGGNGINGSSSAVLLTTEGLIGGPGGTGGKGGNSTSGATGGNGAVGQVTGISVINFTTFTPQTFQQPALNGTFFLRQRQDVSSGVTTFTATNSIYCGGGHGGGGGGSAANGAITGFAGGAGGGGGGTTVIYARNIIVGPSTNSSAIAANGGDGGLVGTVVLNAAAGGGGGAGGGGFVYLLVGSISGTSGIPFVSANGGTGGNGGTATGTNIGGQGGSGGNGGKITVINMSNNSVTIVDSTAVAGAIPAIPTGVTGTAGGAGATCTDSS